MVHNKKSIFRSKSRTKAKSKKINQSPVRSRRRKSPLKPRHVKSPVHSRCRKSKVKSKHRKSKVKSAPRRKSKSKYLKKSKAFYVPSIFSRYSGNNPFVILNQESPGENPTNLSPNQESPGENPTNLSPNQESILQNTTSGLSALPLEIIGNIFFDWCDNGGTVSLYDLYLLIKEQTEKYNSLSPKLPAGLKHWMVYRTSSKNVLNNLTSADDITSLYNPTSIIHINSTYTPIENPYFWNISNWAGPNMFATVQLIKITHEKTNLQKLLNQPTFWNNLPSLTTLNLAYNKIGDGFGSLNPCSTYLSLALEKLTKLTSLDLSGNYLRVRNILDLGPGLAKLKDLITLDLSGNYLELGIDGTRALIDPLANLSQFSILNLRLNDRIDLPDNDDVSLLKSEISSPSRPVTIMARRHGIDIII